MPAGDGRPDAVVVGAGFAGLYMLHLLRQRGYRALVLEAGSDVGGTWFWNRYPGARCDVPSVEYSYSFSPEIEAEWTWTERYAAQPEILAYLRHVADRLDLRRDIRFDTRLAAAEWQEDAACWRMTTDRGDTLSARILILATGALSAPKRPDWPGIGDFAGVVMHTGQWDETVPLEGRRIGVVGTGSSGIQAIPQLARVARSVTVFQRTPSFAVPAGNRPLTDADRAALRPRLRALRDHARHSPLGWFDAARPGRALDDDDGARRIRYEEQWRAGTTGLLMAYEDLLFNEAANETAAQFARGKIGEAVRDPGTARMVTPTGYPIGSRRLCSEIGYYESLNRDNVTVVDLREEPVERVEAGALVTGRGRYDIDMLVLATGFNALTGAIAAIDITGRNGRRLADEWLDGPRAYLGLAVAGFPNLFTVTGPGSPSVFSNVVVSIEQHVEWIADCLDHLRARQARVIVADAAAEQDWMRHSDAIAQMTVIPRGNSWYFGRTRDGGRVFLPYVGGVGTYRAKCDAFARDGYAGFVIAP